MLSAIILLDSCQEALRVEESAHPEGSWYSLLNPFLVEAASLLEILNPRIECFHGQKGNSFP